jgi:hypothetical protein
MADFVAEMELAVEAAEGLAINMAEDKAAADQEEAEIKVLYDQLLESASQAPQAAAGVSRASRRLRDACRRCDAGLQALRRALRAPRSGCRPARALRPVAVPAPPPSVR